MLYGKSVFRRRGVFLAFIATTIIVLLLLADHLLRGSRTIEAISGSHSGSILFQSSGTHSAVVDSARLSNFNAKWRHQAASGDIRGTKGSANYKQWHGGSRNVSKQQLVCRDAMCTNYLSKSDMNTLLQCQRNATRKIKRLARRWSHNDVKSPLLVTLRRDNSTGALSSGSCRFIEGKGKDA